VNVPGRRTCGGDLVERPVWLLRQVAGDVVAQADRRHRYEAVVERVEEVPVGLDDREDRRRNEEDDDEHDAEDDEDVRESDVEHAQCLTEPGLQQRYSTQVKLGQKQ